jgi:hypothetical protein
VLTTIIKQIFPTLEDKQMGTYDINELKELWSAMEENAQSKIQNLTEEYESSKYKMEQ